MRKREIMKDIKQYELSYDQIDQIVIEELKEVIELNWNGDHELIDASFTLLAYFMPREDYTEYREHLKLTPPRDSNYENTN